MGSKSEAAKEVWGQGYFMHAYTVPSVYLYLYICIIISPLSLNAYSHN